MENTSMTALVSAFARAYHAAQKETKIFDDPLARQLLSDEESRAIAQNMADGIAFFSPGFCGTQAEALRRIMDCHLSPTPLGRAAFAERALHTAVRCGARQYLILGAGFDTFAYRQPDWAQPLEIFELDQPAMSADKRRRLECAELPIPDNVHLLSADLSDSDWTAALTGHPAFDRRRITLCSALGLVYYLPKSAFAQLLSALAGILPQGSGIVFDYPDRGRDGVQTALAGGAGEPMQASYSYPELEALLAEHGFLIYEHLTPQEITAQYFADYNRANPEHPMSAQSGVNYCLAVRR